MVDLDHRTQAGRSPFGELLVRFRTERGLTQEGLANAMTGGRISARSITNYERSTDTPQDWILPHRPTIRALAAALSLTESQQHLLVDAWDTSRLRKEFSANQVEQGRFIRSGREHLIHQLHKHWNDARGGKPHIVLVSAEAGMGKTSLASYFCELVASDHRNAVISWGDSTNYGATTEPYIAIRYATDRLLVPPMPGFRIPGGGTDRRGLTMERVEEILTYLPRLTGALVSDRTITKLGKQHPEIPEHVFTTILNQNVGTEAIGRWDEYTRLLYSLSQDWPILIVLEDLHWAGDLTASLLLHLHSNLSRATNMPVMILGTVRSDEIDLHKTGSPSPLANLIRQLEKSHAGAHISMADTLSPEHGRAFIKGLLRSYPMTSETNEAELIDSLYVHTSGQPLLTTEMLRHLVESGALTASPPLGLWTYDPSASKDKIPSAISSFIEQRLERVSRRGRALLEASAVMGEWMLADTAASVLGLEESQTVEFIDSVLVDKHRLLQPMADVLVGQQHHHAYRFSHALVRDYVYSTTPLSRRRSLHIKLAEALESLVTGFDMVTMGAVANHYAQAEDWYGAEMAAYTTAQISVGRMAWDLGEFWFDQAEELAVKARDPRQLWRTRAARVAMLRGEGSYEDAVDLGRRILRQVAYQDWPAVEALACHHLGEVLLDLGEIEESTALLIRARDIHLDLDHTELAVAAATMLSHTTYRQGHYDIAREHATMAIELEKTLPVTWVNAEVLLAAGNCEIDLGFYSDALERYQVAVEVARTLDNFHCEIAPAINIGLCLTFMGRHEDAVRHLQPFIKRIESLTSIRHTGFPLYYLGLAYEALGEIENARIAYQRSTDVRQSTPQTPTQFDSICGLLRVAVISGDVETTQTLVQQIEAFINKHTWRGMEYGLLVLTSLAEAHRFLGNQDRYKEIVEEAHDELLHRASLLQDPASVDSYLNRVEINVKVLELFNSLASS